jgi:hypothetical protein
MLKRDDIANLNVVHWDKGTPVRSTYCCLCFFFIEVKVECARFRFCDHPILAIAHSVQWIFELATNNLGKINYTTNKELILEQINQTSKFHTYGIFIFKI